MCVVDINAEPLTDLKSTVLQSMGSHSVRFTLIESWESTLSKSSPQYYGMERTSVSVTSYHVPWKTCKRHFGFPYSEATKLLKQLLETTLTWMPGLVNVTLTPLDSSYSSAQLDEQEMYATTTWFHLTLPYLKSTSPCSRSVTLYFVLLFQITSKEPLQSFTAAIVLKVHV